MKSFQKKYLRGLAHGEKPVVFIGQKGITDTLINSINEALEKHELIKVKFVEIKEKRQKQEFIEVIENKCGSTSVGMIGHTAIFYRRQEDPQKRKINLPQNSIK